MKTKALLLSAIFGLSASYSFAQLSTREDDQSTYKIGTRPVKGNLGYYLGVKTKDVQEVINKLTDDESSDEPLRYEAKVSFVNLKYYLADNTVLRLGADIYKKKRLVEGTVEGGSFKNKLSNRYYVVNLGLEKHFSKTNFLDPYVGAEIYAGALASTVSNSLADPLSTTEQVKKGTSLLYGAGAFLGLQAFVADLPVSVGFEWGFVGLGYLGSKYKVEEKVTTGGVSTNSTYYESVVEGDGFEGVAGKTLKTRQFDLSGMFRLNLSYYFTK